MIGFADYAISAFHDPSARPQTRKLLRFEAKHHCQHVVARIWQPGSGCRDLVARIWQPGSGSRDLVARIWYTGSGCQAPGSQDLVARIWQPRSGSQDLVARIRQQGSVSGVCIFMSCSQDQCPTRGMLQQRPTRRMLHDVIILVPCFNLFEYKS